MKKHMILKTSDDSIPEVHISSSPMVDIAVTTFNAKGFLEDCIKSIVEQTYPLWKIYFVDDCSRDGTVEKIKELVKKYDIRDRAEFFQTEKNSGYGTSLKWAIEVGDGELVAVVDSDDYLEDKDALDITVKEHQKMPEVSMIYSDYVEITSRNYARKHLIRAKPPTKHFLGEFKGGIYNGTDADISHLKTFKREFYEMTVGLDHRLLKAVDKDLILKLEEVGKLHYCRKALYCYRKHSASISTVWRDRSQPYRKRAMDLKSEMYLNAKHRRENGILQRIGNMYTYSEGGMHLGLNYKKWSKKQCI